MGFGGNVPEAVGQFSRSRIVKFGLVDASDEDPHTRNRSGAITLPIGPVVSGASP